MSRKIQKYLETKKQINNVTHGSNKKSQSKLENILKMMYLNKNVCDIAMGYS